MSSWRKQSVNRKIERFKSEQLHTFSTKYDKYKFIHIINKSRIYGAAHHTVRMFNCAVIVKHKDGGHSFVLKEDTDTIIFIYRQTPLEGTYNSIYMCDLNKDTMDIIKPITGLITSAKHGCYEDARFFMYKDTMGLSYTFNYTMGISLLQEDKLKLVDLPFNKISPIEKNWTFFEHDGLFLGIRFYKPLVIYTIDLSGSTIIPHKKWVWDIPGLSSSIRGGAPPVLVGDRYYIFTHSAVTYHTFLLTIHKDTLKPLEFTPSPLFKDINSKFQFICGAIFDANNYRWILTMGIDDIYCGIVTIFHTDILQQLRDIHNDHVSDISD